MRFTSLTDIAVESCRDRYDLAIFASGFEARATALAEQLGNEVARDIVVLGFRTQRGILSRQRNDAFYSSVIGVSPVIPEANQDDLAIFEALERVCKATTGPIWILVDYSVMTRSWYAAALNWLRLSSRTGTVTVDFVYAQGSYQGSHDPLQITDISAIDGFEGVVSGKRNTSALFCLGFDKYATLAVHERIEPEEFTCFIVTNGRDFPVLPDISGQNASLIAMSGQSEVVLPLASVSEQFRVICEYLIHSNRDTMSCLVPMGPKPFCLASLLACLRMPETSCLHVIGARGRPVEVLATGQFIVTRTEFGANNAPN